MNITVREFARNIIHSEIEEFNHNQKAYLEAMGWNENEWPDINEVILNFNVSDIDQLEYAINLNIQDGSIENIDHETIFHSNVVSDFRVNLVAEKIHKIYGVD